MSHSCCDTLRKGLESHNSALFDRDVTRELVLPIVSDYCDASVDNHVAGTGLSVVSPMHVNG